MRSIIIKTVLVILAAAANIALGIYWYGSDLAGRLSSSSHHTASAMRHPNIEQIVVVAVGSLLTAFALSMVARWVSGKNAGFLRREGVALLIATIAWVGFAAATAAKHYAFMGHSQELLALDYGYDLAGMLVMAIVVMLAQ